MKGYRTPPNLQVFEFVEVQKKLFVAQVERGIGSRRGDCRGSVAGFSRIPDSPAGDLDSAGAGADTGPAAFSDTAS
jgi:hypothetical protein